MGAGLEGEKAGKAEDAEVQRGINTVENVRVNVWYADE